MGVEGQLPLTAIHGFTFMPQPLLPVSIEWEVSILLSVLDHQSVWKELLCKTGNTKYFCKFKIFTI